MAKEEFRLNITHPHAEDLSSGQIVTPGETFKADANDERVKRLVDEGAAQKVPTKPKTSGGSK